MTVASALLLVIALSGGPLDYRFDQVPAALCENIAARLRSATRSATCLDGQLAEDCQLARALAVALPGQCGAYEEPRR